MRNVISNWLFLLSFLQTTLTIQLSSPYLKPFLAQEFPPDKSDTSFESNIFQNETLPSPLSHAIAKRATVCGANAASCDYMGVTGFCCPSGTQCALDPVGHVACCPLAAQCTGTLTAGGFPTQFLPNTNTAPQPRTSQQTTAAPAVAASFVQSKNGNSNINSDTGTTTSAQQQQAAQSFVSNQFFTFPAIPTTYPNAAACSLAWSTCQSHMAQCTAYLQGEQAPSLAADSGAGAGIPGYTVSIEAPNLISPAVSAAAAAGTEMRVQTTLPPASALGVCSLLSSAACSGLQVTACSVFGNGVGGVVGMRETGRAREMVLAAAVGVAGLVL